MSQLKQKSAIIILISLFLLLVSLPVAADEEVTEPPLYLYYFETTDSFLTEGETQNFRFATLPNEDVTIVAYGLDELLVPQITLYNADGEQVTMSTAHQDQPFVHIIQFSTPSASGISAYSFEVTANPNVSHPTTSGLIRVMLFEGDPLDTDLTYLDTVNPLLPGRAFMVAGRVDDIPTDPNIGGLQIQLEVLPVDRFRERPQVFSSRGSDQALPNIPDRFQPNVSDGWWNDDESQIYFFTVSPIPERLTDVTRDIADEYETFNLLTFFYFDYLFIVGEGSDPVLFQGSQPCSNVSLETRAECVEDSGTLGRDTGESAPDDGETSEVGEEDSTINTTPPTFTGEIPDCRDAANDLGLIITIGTAPAVGDDQIAGSNCSDNITGYVGVVTGSTGHEIFGNSGDDVIIGSSGDDAIVAGNGNDFIIGGNGEDSIFGDAGSDTILGNVDDDADVIIGGDDNDMIIYTFDYDSDTGTYNENTSGITVVLPEQPVGNNNNASLAGGNQPDNLIGIEGVTGTSGDDTLTGSSDDNLIIGGAGGDTIDGGAGDDTIYGQAGPDGLDLDIDGDGIPEVVFVGGAGDDDIIDGGTGNDTIYGNTGNDEIAGGDGDDAIDGGDGDDIITGDDGNDTILGDFGDDEIAGGEGDDNISGGDGNDTLDGDEGNDTIIGGDGDDTLDGGDGDDILRGQVGDDIVIGGDGDDELHGGDGADNISGGDGADNILGGADDDTIDGGDGDDIIDGGATGDDIINGGAGNDNIDARDGDNTVDGDDGDDTIVTGIGNDDISGGDGDDTINAGDGDDIIDGDAGEDIIFSEGGSDTISGGDDDDQIYVTGTGVISVQGDGGTDIIDIDATFNAGSTIDLASNDGAGLGTDDQVIISASTSGEGDLILGYDQILDFSAAPTPIIADLDDSIDAGGGILVLDVSFDSAPNCTSDAECDTYYAGTYPEVTFISGSGDDTISTSIWADDTITAGAGNDTIYGSLGNDVIEGGGGTDFISFNTEFAPTPYEDDMDGATGSVVTIDLNTNQITIDIPNGPTFNQTITSVQDIEGSIYNDTLTGNDSNNTIYMTTGDDIVDGGDGTDTADFSTNITTGVSINLTDTDAVNGLNPDSYVFTGSSGTIDNVEIVVGTDFDDTFYPDTTTTLISAGTGTDTISYETQNNATPNSFTVIACNTICGDGSVGLGTVVTGGSVFYSIEVVNGADEVSTVQPVNDTFTVIAGNYSNTYSDLVSPTIDVDTGLTLSGGVGADTYNFSSGTTGYFVIDTPISEGGDDTVLLDGITATYSIVPEVDGVTVYNIVGSNIYLTFESDCAAGDNYLIFGDAGDDVFDTSEAEYPTLQSPCNEVIDGGGGNDTADYSATVPDATLVVTIDSSVDPDAGAITIDGGANLGTDTLIDVDTIVGNDSFQDVLIITGDGSNGGLDLEFVNGTSASGASTTTTFDTSTGDTIDFSTIDTSGDINGIIIDLSNTGSQNIFIGVPGADDLSLTINNGSGGESQFLNIVGSVGNDTITGNGYANILEGGTGNDTISGNAGNDEINGGAGTDTLNGDAGDDTINGGDANDIIDGGTGADTLNGDAGDDTIDGGDDNDTINGGTGIDTINGEAGADTVNGGDGNDVIDGGTGADTLNGDAGNDTINGGDDNDIINGGIGADTIDGEDGDDTINGGDDNDIIDGGIGADTLNGDAGNDTINGGANNDIINGGTGVDTLNGDAGDDTINGGDDGDIIDGGTGADTINGEAGADTINGDDDDDIIDGGTGADTINGEDGNDTINGGDDGDIITGGNGNDIIDGGAGDDNISGNANDDTIDAGDGADTVNGGSGTDEIVGNLDTSIDSYTGGTGTDTLDYTDGGTASTPIGLIVDVNAGGSGTTDVDFNGVVDDIDEIEIIILNDGNDVITINNDNSGDLNTIDGSAGTDTITYAVGNDDLTINTTSENNFTVNGNDVDTLNNIENITTSTGDDTFNITYEATGTANTFDAGGAGDNDTADLSNSTIGLTITQIDADSFTVSDGAAGVVDNFDNFEELIVTDEDDTFIAADGPIGMEFDGSGETTSGGDTVDYSATTDDLTVNTVNTGFGGNDTPFEVTDGTNTDDLEDVETITTGSGNDTFNIDLDHIDDAHDTGGATVTFTFNTGAGNSTFNFDAGGAINGNSPISIIINADSTSTTTLDFSAVTVSGVTIDVSDTNSQTVFTNFSVTVNGQGSWNVTGTGSADTITGDDGANTINGGGGADTIDGGAGADTINGDAGDDIITGGDDADTINGGDGDDEIDGGDGADVINGDADNDTIVGGEGADTISGGAGADTIVGGNVVDCTGDPCDGGTDGADTINGDAGTDTIVGGNVVNCVASITCTGGTDASDTIDGGADADVVGGGNTVNCATLDDCDGGTDDSDLGNETIDAADSGVTGNTINCDNTAPDPVSATGGTSTGSDDFIDPDCSDAVPAALVGSSSSAASVEVTAEVSEDITALEATSEPETTAAPETTAEATPVPVATNTPEPAATNTPEPAATDTPEPAATTAPSTPDSTSAPETTAESAP